MKLIFFEDYVFFEFIELSYIIFKENKFHRFLEKIKTMSKI